MLPLLASLILTAGAPHQVGGALDCSLGYDGLLKMIASETGARPAPVGANQPFGVYENSQTLTLYTFTMPEAGGHPAVVKRQVRPQAGVMRLETSACGYGDKAGFDRLMVQFQQLNGQIQEQLKR